MLRWCAVANFNMAQGDRMSRARGRFLDCLLCGGAHAKSGEIGSIGSSNRARAFVSAKLRQEKKRRLRHQGKGAASK
jgi:hypothetical protein